MGAVQASLPTCGSSLGAAASPPQLAIPGDLRVAQALGPAPPTSLGAPRGSGPALPGPLCLLPRDALEGWVREGWGDALGGGGPQGWGEALGGGGVWGCAGLEGRAAGWLVHSTQTWVGGLT